MLNLPWMKFYTRDWLDSKGVRRCSPLARSVLIDLMAIAHEGYPYGYLSDQTGGLSEVYLFSRCVVSDAEFKSAIGELISYGRIAIIDGVYFIPRMVKDEQVRLARAAGGIKGGNPNLIHKKVNLEDIHNGKPEGLLPSVSVSVSDSVVKKEKVSRTESPTFEDWWQHWWNKAGKADAAKAFKICSSEFGAAFLIQEVIADRKRFEGHRSWEFRSKLYPATWLRGRRWEDELPPEVHVNGKQSTSQILKELYGDFDD